MPFSIPLSLYFSLSVSLFQVCVLIHVISITEVKQIHDHVMFLDFIQTLFPSFKGHLWFHVDRRDEVLTPEGFIQEYQSLCSTYFSVLLLLGPAEFSSTDSLPRFRSVPSG